MNKDTELKPCPFCGREAVIRHDSCGYYDECDNGMLCPVVPTTWYYKTEIGAINAWNRRANDEHISQRYG